MTGILKWQMKRKAITITLPIEMYEEIKNLAILNKRTLSSQLEMIIEEKLKEFTQDEKID